MPDLLATCWLTAGDAAPQRGDERSPYQLEDRVVAAANAGFTGFGFVHADLGPAVREYGWDGLRQIFIDNRIEHVELEFLGGWWSDGDERATSDAVRHDLLEAARRLDARHIKVGGDVSGADWDYERWVREFRRLSDEAAAAGTRIALEPMPFSNIATIQDGLKFVEDADSDAGGLMVDIWHVVRAGTPVSEVAKLPAKRIVGVELNDADVAPVGSLWDDTINNRKLCGEGSFEVEPFIEAVRSTGWSGPWGVEVISRQVRETPLQAMTVAAFETTIRQFS